MNRSFSQFKEAREMGAYIPRGGEGRVGGGEEMEQEKRPDSPAVTMATTPVQASYRWDQGARCLYS